MKKRWLAGLLLLAIGFWLASDVDGRLHHPRPSQLFLDRRGVPLGEVSGESGAMGFWPLPSLLPEKLVLATLETEDRTYFTHAGVRPTSVARAAWQNVYNLRVVSGASTIAMQVARLQRPRPRTLFTKAHEALEALVLIHQHGHDAVLRQYLTLAPYGNNTHGAVRAARLYFDKPVQDLSWLQAAYLAALPQQPGRMSPFTTEGRQRGLARAHRILRQLHARGVLDADGLAQALASDVELAPKPSRDPSLIHVLAELASPYLQHSVTTSIDLSIQRLAHQAVNAGVSALQSKGVGTGAALVIDLPSGEVLARVGSHDYFDAANHGALDYTRVRRSPGSTLKPFIYATALDRGLLTPATMLADTPAFFATPGGSMYVPENVSHTFLGPLSMRQALANSRNIPALRVLAQVGVDQMIEVLERGGVRGLQYAPEAYGLPLALGSLHVTPLELAQLYTSLANDGITVPLRHVLDAPATPGLRLFGTEAAQLIRHVLADAEARQPSFPAGSALDFDYAVAIKTGTSQGYRDAWAAALSDRLLVLTWFGNHDWRRMNVASGATVAAPATHALMESAMALRDPARPVTTRFALPAGSANLEVCAVSGQLPGPGCTHTVSEHFVRGSEPVEPCNVHVEIDIDTRTGLLATAACPPEVVRRRRVVRLPEQYSAWARRQRVELAPLDESPLCPSGPPASPTVTVTEPHASARYLYDPDTPREYATVLLAAKVSPSTEKVIWFVDGQPVGEVAYPHELRWSMTPGPHHVRAQLSGLPQRSAPVSFTVSD